MPGPSRSLIKHFIEEELEFKNIDVNKTFEKNKISNIFSKNLDTCHKNNYKSLKHLHSYFKYSCKYPKITSKNINFDLDDLLDIKNNETIDINNLLLDNIEIKKCLIYEKHKKKNGLLYNIDNVIIPFGVTFNNYKYLQSITNSESKMYKKYNEDIGGHYMVMLFNIVDKTYTVWDPVINQEAIKDSYFYELTNLFYNKLPKKAAINLNNRRTYFKFVKQTIPKKYSIQSFIPIIENTGYCTLLTLFITHICLRFKYFNFQDISTKVLLNYLEDEDKIMLLKKLIIYYEPYYNNPTKVKKGIFNPNPTIGYKDGICITFDNEVRCKRESCPNDAYCWQHRYLSRKPYAKDKSCNESM